MKKLNPRGLKCHRCNEIGRPLLPAGKDFICEPCHDVQRKGRDETTRSLRAQSRDARDQAEMHRQHKDNAPNGLADVSGHPLVTGSVNVPIDAALDALAHRRELLTNLGTDAAALAVEASHHVAVNNPLEEMLVHQMVVAHKIALESITKAHLDESLDHSIRLLNTSIRFMDSYQRAMLTLKRFRAKGEQTILVQHVKVTDGGQAVIGTVQSNGGAEK